MRNRADWIAVTAIGVVFLPVAFAWAHDEVKSWTPREQSAVQPTARTSGMTFSEAVRTGVITIERDPAGGYVVRWRTGPSEERP